MSPSYSNYGASTSSPWMNGSPVGAAAVRTAGSSRRSSRDKGKQRARYEEEVGDDHHDGDGQSAAAQLGGAYKVDSVGGMPFNIRFTDGTTEDLLDLFVNESETVREVKRRIRLLRSPALDTNRLRLIYLGRILTDGTRLVPWIVSILQKQKQQEEEQQRTIASTIEGVVKNAVSGLELDNVVRPSHSRQGSQHGRRLSSSDAKSAELGDASTAKGKGKGKMLDKSQENHPARGKTIWLHCSVGEPGSLEQEAEVEALQPSQLKPLTGFDRLREAGFSEEEIATMRAQFHEDGPSDTAVAGDDDEHARALEEQWMEGLGAGGNDTTSPTTGMYTTLFKGVVAGFCLPFLPLFFFKTEPPVFSKRMQMAIVGGVSINVLYGALRAFA